MKSIHTRCCGIVTESAQGTGRREGVVAPTRPMAILAAQRTKERTMKTLSMTKGDKNQQDMTIHALAKLVAGAAPRRQP